MNKNLVDEVVGAAARVVASGAISANGHGNISLRVPGAEEMYFTSAPSLRGVLVFHRTAELAVLVGGVVEEAAQAAINAQVLGGPVEIPGDMRAAALQRAMAFDTAGTKNA